MPMIAAVKVVALSLILICVASSRTMPEVAMRGAMADAAPPRLQCRMYFGCTPAASLNTAVAQRQEYVR